METIHAIHRDGTILTGTDALKALYDTVGLGWAARLGSLPILGEVGGGSTWAGTKEAGRRSSLHVDRFCLVGLLFSGWVYALQLGY